MPSLSVSTGTSTWQSNYCRQLERWINEMTWNAARQAPGNIALYQSRMRCKVCSTNDEVSVLDRDERIVQDERNAGAGWMSASK